MAQTDNNTDYNADCYATGHLRLLILLMTDCYQYARSRGPDAGLLSDLLSGAGFIRLQSSNRLQVSPELVDYTGKQKYCLMLEFKGSFHRYSVV